MKSSSGWEIGQIVGAPGVRTLSRSSIAALAIAIIGLSPSAIAGTGGLTVEVTPRHAGDLSYSAPAPLQDAVGAFNVVISNPTNANVNNVWFRATTKSASGGQAVFIDLPAECAQDTTSSPDAVLGVVCKFSKFPAGSSPKSFSLRVRTPYAPLTPYAGSCSLPSYPDAGDCFVLSTLTQAGQGAENTSNAVWDDSRPTYLIRQVKTEIISFVDGGTLDVWVSGQGKTLVKPSKPATVEIKQELNPSSCLADFRKCFTSTLKIVEPVKKLGADGQPLVGLDGKPVYEDKLIKFEYPKWLEINLIREKSTLSKTASIWNSYLFLKYHEVPGGDWYYIPACIANADPANPSVKWTIDPNNTVSTSRCVVPPNTDNTGPTYVDKKGQFVYGILAESNGSVDW